MDTDEDDIQLAHNHRLSLTTSPRQSSFRVLAIVFYELDDDCTTNTPSPPVRRHVVGTNDEPCFIGGSICAERAAMVQLRFLPNLRQITKVVISTDSVTPISPGLLCREFLASDPKVPWDVSIVLAGSVCRHCNLDISSSRDEESAICKLRMPCAGSSDTQHDWAPIKSTLRTLYPHPSAYARLNSKEATRLGKESALNRGRPVVGASNSVGFLSEQASDLLDRAIEAAKLDDRINLHPIQYGAAVLFSNGDISTEYQKKALEYGCSLDSVTQLAPEIEKNSRVGIRPVLLVQTDQFGVVHPPFAPARAFLSEHGYGDCRVLVAVNSSDGESSIQEVAASELAPNAPDLGDLCDSGN